MNAPNPDLRTLYSWVRQTREVLFSYTESLPSEVYTQSHPAFPFGGSIRNLHAHVAECYLWWSGHVGQGQPKPQFSYSDIDSVKVMRGLFAMVDQTVQNAIDHTTDLDASWVWQDPQGVSVTLTKRWTLLHPITHEFHHKGQIVTLGRILGYPLPVGSDSDLVLPF